MSNERQATQEEISRREFLAAGVGAGAPAALSGILPTDAAAAPEPAGSSGLERAHAHNDYEHARPLLDALARGFKSVEADVWLVDGELLVAHERALVQPGRTLESLYLKPLARTVGENGGSVYPGDPDYFTLLVDIKSEAEPTYRVLHEQLRRHDAMLTTFGSGGVRDGAVTVVVSGNRPRELMRKQRVRHAAYDGRLSDLGVDTDQTFTPLISDNWTRNFTWQGIGPMSEAEREKLRAIVSEAHANGQRVRFWATPELPEAREAVWGELVAARADHVNTDHLEELEVFLLRNDPSPTEPHVSWAGRAGGR
jgi:hypothetical protein